MINFDLPTVLALYILGIAVVMYIMLMGPSNFHRNGIVGKLNRALYAIPGILGACCCLPCAGCRWGRARKKWASVSDLVMNKRHPGMMIFYVIMVGLAEFFYLSIVVPMLPHLVDKATSWIFIVVSEVFFALSVFSDPGTVTPRWDEEHQAAASPAGSTPGVKFSPKVGEKRGAAATSETSNSKSKKKFLLCVEEEAIQNRRHVVDGVLYPVGKTQSAQEANVLAHQVKNSFPLGVDCTTCLVPRPARSKHCSLCNRCVRRFDHHCPWINNDVGENNHRWFVLFLASHVLSCGWATRDCFAIISDIIQRQRLWDAVFLNSNNHRVRANWSNVLLYLLNQYTTVMCVGIFTSLIGLCLLFFWLHQMYMVASNLTSNDIQKIEDCIEFLERLPLDRFNIEARNIAHHINQVKRLYTPNAVSDMIHPQESILTSNSKRKTAKKSNLWRVNMVELPNSPVVDTETPSKELINAVKKYRKVVTKLLKKELRQLFSCDSSAGRNVRDVLFPYTISKYEQALRTKRVKAF